LNTSERVVVVLSELEGVLRQDEALKGMDGGSLRLRLESLLQDLIQQDRLKGLFDDMNLYLVTQDLLNKFSYYLNAPTGKFTRDQLQDFIKGLY
jgi:hypothetical protein